MVKKGDWFGPHKASVGSDEGFLLKHLNFSLTLFPHNSTFKSQLSKRPLSPFSKIGIFKFFVGSDGIK